MHQPSRSAGVFDISPVSVVICALLYVKFVLSNFFFLNSRFASYFPFPYGLYNIFYVILKDVFKLSHGIKIKTFAKHKEKNKLWPRV